MLDPDTVAAQRFVKQRNAVGRMRRRVERLERLLIVARPYVPEDVAEQIIEELQRGPTEHLRKPKGKANEHTQE